MSYTVTLNYKEKGRMYELCGDGPNMIVGTVHDLLTKLDDEDVVSITVKKIK